MLNSLQVLRMKIRSMRESGRGQEQVKGSQTTPTQIFGAVTGSGGAGASDGRGVTKWAWPA